SNVEKSRTNRPSSGRIALFPTWRRNTYRGDRFALEDPRAGTRYFPAANFTTFAHFSVSRLQIAPNCWGVTRMGRPPTSASRAAMDGAAGPAWISRWRVIMTPAGGPAGTALPVQPLTS